MKGMPSCSTRFLGSCVSINMPVHPTRLNEATGPRLVCKRSGCACDDDDRPEGYVPELRGSRIVGHRFLCRRATRWRADSPCLTYITMYGARFRQLFRRSLDPLRPSMAVGLDWAVCGPRISCSQLLLPLGRRDIHVVSCPSSPHMRFDS
jgi:hypothetical protein